MASRYAPTIDATGISAPDFPTILANLTADYLGIFGADADVDEDSQDGQFIGIIAQALADCNAAAIACYNAFSPATAQGAGLASVIKINGLSVKGSGFSTVDETLVGVAGTVITNGQVSDGTNTWALPTSVTIPLSGTIDVTATCTVAGAITAAIGAVSKIKTPTFGWQTATNAAVPSPGQPVESDAAVRVRQAVSTSLPSQLIFDGIVATILAVEGVTRVAAYENNTGSTNSLGIAANTVSFIIEGGAIADIFTAINSKMTPGIPMAGAESQIMVSPAGSTRLIKWDRPTNATIAASITVKALTGWAVTTEAVIAKAIFNYLQALPGGAVVGVFDLAVPAKLENTPFFGTFRVTAITIGKNGGSLAATDIALAYNEMAVAAADLSGISFTVT